MKGNNIKKSTRKEIRKLKNPPKIKQQDRNVDEFTELLCRKFSSSQSKIGEPPLISSMLLSLISRDSSRKRIIHIEESEATETKREMEELDISNSSVELMKPSNKEPDKMEIVPEKKIEKQQKKLDPIIKSKKSPGAGGRDSSKAEIRKGDVKTANNGETAKKSEKVYEDQIRTSARIKGKNSTCVSETRHREFKADAENDAQRSSSSSENKYISVGKRRSRSRENSKRLNHSHGKVNSSNLNQQQKLRSFSKEKVELMVGRSSPNMQTSKESKPSKENAIESHGTPRRVEKNQEDAANKHSQEKPGRPCEKNNITLSLKSENNNNSNEKRRNASKPPSANKNADSRCLEKKTTNELEKTDQKKDQQSKKVSQKPKHRHPRLRYEDDEDARCEDKSKLT